jgi:hypothetical protein
MHNAVERWRRRVGTQRVENVRCNELDNPSDGHVGRVDLFEKINNNTWCGENALVGDRLEEITRGPGRRSRMVVERA